MNNLLENFKIPVWIPAGISSAISVFWAYWGINENFHEGWYMPSLAGNLALMLIQYLSPMLISMALMILSIVKPKFGAIFHAIAGIFLMWFLRGGNIVTVVLVGGSFVILGCLYFFSARSINTSFRKFFILAPMITLLVAGFSPAIRVAQRSQIVDHSTHTIFANGMELAWAPAGPGWPETGAGWKTARNMCGKLDESGKSLTEHQTGIWRLPTADEAVRSMMRHGENCGGAWNDKSGTAVYEIQPDKEAPFWDIYSPVIYWWTASEIDENRAWMIEYDGQVWPRSKEIIMTSLGYRCVKEVQKSP